MKILRSAPAPWDDYGSVLWHGLVHQSSSADSPLEIERSGPFVPPISFPWPTVVVTDSIRAQLEQLAPRGCELRPVVVKRVVDLDWHTWDVHADPRLLPAGGEPENYILRRRHSAKIASLLEPLWELFVPATPGLQLEHRVLNRAHYSGEDICRASRFGVIFVSDSFGSWLESVVGAWVNLREAEIAG